MSIMEAKISVLGVNWDRQGCKKNEWANRTFPLWRLK